MANPTKFWNPEDLILHVRQNGSPQVTPGTGYYYSDTNYVLLGLVIQELTDKTLHEVYPELSPGKRGDHMPCGKSTGNGYNWF